MANLLRAVGVVLLAAVALPAAASATSFAAPVLVSATEAHRETSLALDPKDPSSMFLCDPSGVPNTEYNQSYFHVTHDGGASWKPIRVEGGQTDLRNYSFEGGECDAAHHAGGPSESPNT